MVHLMKVIVLENTALFTEIPICFSLSEGCVKNSPMNSPLPLPGKPEQPAITMMKPALPAFTAGAGYVIPGDYISELYVASLSTKTIPVEDAYTTGFCARKIGLHPPANDGRFSCGQLVTDDCQMLDKFTGHKITPERMWSIQENLKSCPQKTNY